EFEYVRHGTISLIAAMNVTTGEVIAERITRNDSATFTAFLTMLDQSIPPHLGIHLIMDNGSSHTSRATHAWLQAHPRIALTYTPKHAARQHIAEEVVRALTPPAPTPRRLPPPRRPQNQDPHVHHPTQQNRPPLQVELRRRRRTRPLPHPPPTTRHR